MSRSQPTLMNPAQHFFRWSGSKGQLEFYDKEKKEAIKVPLPFEFLFLDELATIKGYSKPDKAGIWSNEVRNSQKEQFSVRVGNQVRFTGFYKNEQGIVQIPKGAAYAPSVYIAHRNRNGDYIIGNIIFSGSARSAWFDFKKSHKVEKGKIVIKRGEAQEAQTGEFFPPIFEQTDATAEQDAKAGELDQELQIYLSQYLSSSKISDEDMPEDEHIDPNIGLATPEQVADFEQRKAAKGIPNKGDLNDEDATSLYQSIAEGEPVEDDQIPF